MLCSVAFLRKMWPHSHSSVDVKKSRKRICIAYTLTGGANELWRSASGVTAEGSPAHPTTLTTCRKRRYLNTSLCYLWCASEGVSPYYLLPQVVRVVGSAGDPSAVTSGSIHSLIQPHFWPFNTLYRLSFCPTSCFFHSYNFYQTIPHDFLCEISNLYLQI